jgi:hypothetical protein
LLRAYPRERLRHEFKQPEMTIIVEVGDLFAETMAHLVVGFSDTFDTTVNEEGVIDSSSVQGQMLRRLYHGERTVLDRDLKIALKDAPIVSQERSESKVSGKLDRYAIGTVAVLKQQDRQVFAIAYSRMGNDLIARATLDDLWHSLNQLWDAIYQHGQRGTVAMPLIGSGLARVDYIERESLLKIVILSFVARSRQRLVCKELRIILCATDLDKINMLEINAFVRNL